MKILKTLHKSRPSKGASNNQGDNSEQNGFTLIEIMLVLGLSGLLLVGLIVNTFSSINTQRYSDTVRSFAEYLRTMYSEAISPQSLGNLSLSGSVTNTGGRGPWAILGKIIVFGYPHGNANETAKEQTRSAYSATVIGDAALPNSSNSPIRTELSSANLRLYCGDQPDLYGPTTTRQYLPLWDGEFTRPRESDGSGDPVNDPFRGSILIVKSPSSGVVHTLYTSQTFDLLTSCQESDHDASTAFHDYMTDVVSNHPTDLQIKEIGICVKSPSIKPSLYREIKIAQDGRNTSAVNTIDVDSDENKCRGN